MARYNLGKTKHEKEVIFNDITKMIEEKYSLEDIGKKYDVSKQAISYFLTKRGYYTKIRTKDIKKENLIQELEESYKRKINELSSKYKSKKAYCSKLSKENKLLKSNYNLNLGVYENKDIIINNEFVLHINRNDEGYSFDVYEARLYEKDNYDDGFITGTWFHESELAGEDE